MFTNRRKPTDPFLLFAVLSFLSSLLLGGIICKYCEDYSIDNIQPHISLTLSISLFSTFIPLVFAAITYGKNKLSQTATETFSELSLDNKIKMAWLMLVTLFVSSLATPLMEIENNRYVLLQLCLILCSFVLSASFIWGILKVSKYSNLLPFFGTIARKELKKHILKSNTVENEYVKNRVKNIIENFVTMANVHIRRGSREDLEITLEELQFYACYLFEIINKNLAEIRDPTVHYSQQEVYKNLRRIECLEEIHKKISDLLFVEISKLVHSISNDREEKYLENFAPFLKSIMPSILSIDTGYHSGQWSDFINETVFRTAVLKHTTYPNDAIDLYKELIDSDFRSNPSSAIYGLCPKLHGLLKILAFLKSKEILFKMWYSGLQARVINLMLSILPMCTKYDCDSLIVQKWAEYIREIIPEVYSKDDNPLMDGSPVLSIMQTLSPNSLPFMYQQAAKNIFSSDYDGQIKLRQLHTLTPVYSIYYSLIGKDKDRPGEWTQCLASQFYIDLQICTKISEDVDCWIESVSEEYKNIFKGLKDNYITKRSRIDIFELEHTMAIPAIALVANQEGQIKLANEIVTCFADMLISTFNETMPKNANGRELANILLLSAWLKKTSRLPEKLKELEEILRGYPYSNFNKYMSDYQASGYPSSSFAKKWYLSPSTVWPNNIQQLVDKELMDLDFLVKYGKQFIAKGNSPQDEDKI